MKKILIVMFFVSVSGCSLFPTTEKYSNNKIAVKEEEMISIPAGEVILGNDISAEWKITATFNPIADPIPPLRKDKVFIDSFSLAKFETTNAQFNQFIEAGGYTKKKYWSKEGWEFIKKYNLSVPDHWSDLIVGYNLGAKEYPDYPVLGISWYEANAYAAWREKRLPSDNEWEYAARGKDGREYPWGNNFDKYKCNSMEIFIKATTLVGMYVDGKSPFGIMDMCGNVYEYTSTMLGREDDLKKTYPNYDLTGGAVVVRGGSWDDNAEINKVWRRFLASVENRNAMCHKGIRLSM